MSSNESFYDAGDYPVGQSIGFLVRRLRFSLRRCVDDAMARHGLTDAQWAPLLLISSGRAHTAAALAQTLDLDAGAMTRTLDRLQAKGLLRRVRSHDDRRVWTLELTAAGARAAASIPAELARANNLHLAGFDRQEFEQLHAYLMRMIENGLRARPTPQARVAPGASPDIR